MNIFKWEDKKTAPDIIHPYPEKVKTEHTPMIIDNGSYKCRVGWATEKEPQLIFKNVIAKPRRERGKKDGEILVGNDIANIEAMRFQLKTQFDKNVVINYDVQEHVYDYIFTHMGIDTEGCVDHPIVITEAFLNPNTCRNAMSELLFECYQVPSVTYGVDSLFSYQHNNCPADGLIISLGYQTIHIIPILDGKSDSKNVRRINLGGYHNTYYMQRLLELKYPAHVSSITPSRIEELIYKHSRIATNYIDEISKWKDTEYYKNNLIKVQLPFVAPAANPGLTVEQQKERKRELARRLMEINARKREERLAEDEQQLEQLLAVQKLSEAGKTEDFKKALQSHSLATKADLTKTINNLQSKVEKTKQKIVAANSQEESTSVDEPKPKALKSTLQPKDQQDLNEFLADIRKKRQEILNKRAAKQQWRQDMVKRRTVAAQKRMKLINHLAKDDKGDDDFGTRDEDWEVYKTINKDGGDSDSDEDQEKLLELENTLRQYDPDFENAGSSSNVQMALGEMHQLHIEAEVLRAPEIIFQPHMIGNKETGLAEAIERILKEYTSEEQNRLVSNVFLTGGPAAFPGLIERLHKELLEMRPFQSKFQVNIAKNPSLDAWYGARDFGLNGNLSDFLFTRKEYEEKGGEFFKVHSASNPFFASPEPLPTQVSNITEQTDQVTVEDAEAE